MKLPENWRRTAVRFNQMTLRERLLISVAALVALSMVWLVALSDPLSAKERALRDEMTSLREQITQGETTSDAARRQAALARIEMLNSQLARVDSELVSKSAGLIPPQLMVQAIHDVLRHQQGLKLISLHNQPMRPLAPPAPPVSADGATAADDTQNSETTPKADSGPFVHPVELVIEGSYLDVMRYLQALEASPWRFYWKVLDLQTERYPLNRVRIELTTLSMDKEWVGV